MLEDTHPYSHLKGKKLVDLEIRKDAIVLKFEDDTFLDIYLDKHSQALKTSTNILKS